MKQIISTLDELLAESKKYIKKKESLKLIKQAYEYAGKMHEGQKRKSGEPYITHPLNVAYILATLKVSPIVIAAGLLHDTIEDTETTYDDLVLLFDIEIADLVNGVTNLKRLKYESREDKATKNFQNLFLAMAKDIRVIVIKIADRLHNIRTLYARGEDARKRISKETLEVFIPIIHRLGMYKIKAEIEDSCFRYFDPENYENISNMIEKEKNKSDSGLNEFIKELEDLLSKGRKKPDIKGRVKTAYSIYKKMNNKNKDFNEIFDLLAVRIIVDSIPSCYEVLGTIQQKFKPIPNRFKDYIAIPKANMYQSLHTTVISPKGKIFEVQIRTKEMDAIAEDGVAAHWAYKEKAKYSAKSQQKEISASLPWFKKFVEYSAKDEDYIGDKEEFFNIVMQDLLPADVFVLSPKGRIIDLPKGATVIDFAYRIHTDVGHKMVGATVNRRMVPISYELKTGEVCEIRTSKQSFGPSEDWLKIVKTRHAKNKIRQFFRLQNRDEKEKRGKEKLEKEFAASGLNMNEYVKDEKFINSFQKHDIRTESDLYYSVDVGYISAKTIVDKIVRVNKSKRDSETLIDQYNEVGKNRNKNKSSSGIIVPGVDLPYVKIAKCCMPIPGDAIVGVVTKGSGIVVHNENCHNINNQQNIHKIEVEWDAEVISDNQTNFEVELLITAFDRSLLVADILNTINKIKVGIVNINADVKDNKIANIKLKITVKNSVVLEQVVANIKKIPDVYSVERFNK